MDIFVENVSKIYNIKKGNSIHALNDVSISISQGDFICIKGVSGSGKSTLLHLLGALDRPSSGIIKYDNEVLSEMNDGKLARFRNEHLGFVFQDYALLPYKTVEESVEFPLYFSNIPVREHKRRINVQLEKMQLSDLKKRRISTLSGGQKQRVAIARSLVLDPDIILADEPTGALDSRNSKEVVELLKGINEQGKTVIIVTHDDFIAQYCDRTILIEDGELIENV